MYVSENSLLCTLLIGTLSKVHLYATVTTMNVVKFSTGSEYASKKNTFAENQSSVEISCNSSKGLCLSKTPQLHRLTRQIKHRQREEVTKEKVNGPSCHYLTTNLVPSRLLGSGTSTTLSKKVKFLKCPWLHEDEELIWRKTWKLLLNVEFSAKKHQKEIITLKWQHSVSR